MARIARVVVPDYPHHVTQRGVRSIAIFRGDEDRRLYLKFMREQTEQLGVEILAWCLMTNHVHLVAVPSSEDGLARAVGNAHKAYTRMRNSREGVRGYLFQGRFGSCVLDEPHLLAAARYIDRNPVKARMVRVPWTYRWSSAQFHVGKRQTDELERDRDLRGLVHDWKEFLLQEDPEGEEAVRAATRTGRPAGSDRFVGLIQRLTGRDLSKGLPGRPPKRRRQKSVLCPQISGRGYRRRIEGKHVSGRTVSDCSKMTLTRGVALRGVGFSRSPRTEGRGCRPS